MASKPKLNKQKYKTTLKCDRNFFQLTEFKKDIYGNHLYESENPAANACSQTQPASDSSLPIFG